MTTQPENLEIRHHLEGGHTLAAAGNDEAARACYQETLGDRPLVFFFSPDTCIATHFAPQCVVGKILQDRGATVVFLPCWEIFHPFLLPDLNRVEEWFSPECLAAREQKYRTTSENFLTQYSLPSLDRRAFWTQTLSEEVEKTLAHAPEDLRNFEFEGISFGKLALHDLVLKTKFYNFDRPSPLIQTIWRKFIEQNLIAYTLLKTIYSTFKIRAGLHFNDYSPMLTHRLIGEGRNIPVLGITQATHLNIDRRRYLIVPKTFKQSALERESAWPQFRSLALSPSVVAQVSDDLLCHFAGSGAHIYSPSKAIDQPDIYRDLNLSPQRSLLVAYTSSQDEAVAVSLAMEGMGISPLQKMQPFDDQIAWLQALVEFVESSDNLQLVVRIHPRESKNKRDSRVSQHLQLLLAHFDRPFQHCRFVWPEDPISSYDLAEIADLVLTSWSSMGLECARLGIPVLTATNGISPFPHDDFLEWGQTRELYFQRLLELLDLPISLATITRAFRWYNLYHLGIAVDLSDIVPAANFTGLPKFSRPRGEKTIEKIIIQGKHILDITREDLEKEQFPQSEALEKDAIAEQLCRLIHFIFTGEDNTRTLKLLEATDVENLEDMARVEKNIFPRANAIALRGKTVLYATTEGRIFSRYSPLCARLVPILNLSSADSYHSPILARLTKLGRLFSHR